MGLKVYPRHITPAPAEGYRSCDPGKALTGEEVSAHPDEPKEVAHINDTSISSYAPLIA
jgi:hypothetical protein